VKQGKYIFNELPASLQKRLRYDPLALRAVANADGTTSQVPGVLEFFGLLNDKDIGDATLTAPPPERSATPRPAILPLSRHTPREA